MDTLKLPSFLVQTSFGYCFRIIIPKDIRPFVKKKEIRYSLRTGCVGEAKYRARRMASFVHYLFRDIRRGGRMRELSDVQIKEILDKYFRETLEDLEYRMTMRPEPLDDIRQEVQILEANTAIRRVQKQLGSCDYGKVSREADGILQEHGIELDKESFSYRKLCRELLKVQLRLLEVEKNNYEGDFSHEDQASNSPTLPVQPEEPSESLFKVVDMYIDEQERTNRWTEKSRVEFGACLNLLKDYLGDVPVKSIDHAMMRDYKQALMKLPPNMKKSPLYRDKTVHEILKMDIKKTWATATINKYIDRASCLFEYAIRNGLMDKNPAKGMQLPKSKRDDEYRAIFDASDLNKIFWSEDYMEDIHPKPYQFWMPILALYTGGRLEELSQLHLADIKQVDRVWVFDINNEGVKKTKTKAALRHIPIHPFLLDDLNILGYVEKLKAEGHSRLFPELPLKRDGYGQTVSGWFAKYKVKCGIVVKGQKKDFHSFRHTFINALKQARIDGSMIAEVVGHEVESITFGTYGKRYGADVLFESVIKKLKYDVDLGHLKRSQYVVK